MCLCCLRASKFDPQQSSLLPGYLSPGGLPPSNTGLLKCTLSLQKGSVFLLHIRVRAVHIGSSSCWHGLSPRSCRQLCPWSISVQTFPHGADPTMIFIWSLLYHSAGKNTPVEKEYIHMDPDPKKYTFFRGHQKEKFDILGFLKGLL